MNSSMTTFFAESTPRPRTVVHASAMLLADDSGSTKLSSYLGRESARQVFLIHHGQTELREAAHNAGIEEIKVYETDAKAENELVADMAIAVNAEVLEFTIDRPALKNVLGNRIGELTLHEAEELAGDPAIRDEIRDKLLAGCDALRRGVGRIRIGNPTSLQRDRATLIVPDPPIAMGAALYRDDGEEENDPAPEFDPEDHPLELPTERRSDHPLQLSRSVRNQRRRRYSPQTRCEIGPRRPDPFAYFREDLEEFRPRSRRIAQPYARTA